MSSRFVLLRHEVPGDFPRPSHWDLLLERDHTCWTWAVEDWSLVGDGTTATRLPDHRKHYLTYEGPLSGDRGTVTRQWCGRCTWQQAEAARVRVTLLADDRAFDVQLDQVDGAQWRLTVRPTAP